MEIFYPPQQRWLAQKLTLCCTFLLIFFTASFAQIVGPLVNDDTQQVLVFDGTEGYYELEVPTVAEDPYLETIVLTLRGGDGGIVERDDFCVTTLAHRGSRVAATFEVGPQPGQIPFGAKIRFIPGEQGGSLMVPPPRGGGASGGGSSAVLVSTDDFATYDILTVAAGGGGAWSTNFLGICAQENGDDVLLGMNTGDSGAGLPPFLFGTQVGGSGGGGINDSGEAGSCPMGGGFIADGTLVDGGMGCVGITIDPNGPFFPPPFTVSIPDGGRGFTGGGSGSLASDLNGSSTAGGGGGYSGGDAGRVPPLVFDRAGQRGYSFVSDDATISTIRETGTRANPRNGVIRYQTMHATYIAPRVDCMDYTLELDATGNGTLLVENILADTTMGSFPIESVELDRIKFSCSDLGENTVILTVTDDRGFTSTCGATVTVVPGEFDMIITCPADIVAYATDPAVCGVAVDWNLPAACNTTVVITPAAANEYLPGDVVEVGVHTIAYEVLDDMGVAIATCDFTITVIDRASPVIAAIPDVTEDNDPGECGAVVVYTPTATDNCSDPANIVIETLSGPASGELFPVGVTQVIVMATDEAGNSSILGFNVTITDAEAPTVECPAAITYNVDDGCDFVIPNYTTETALTLDDNCGIVSIKQDPAPGTIISGHATVQTITITVEDAAGLMADCSFDITLDDVTAPEFTSCPGTIARTNDAGMCGAVVTFTTPVADDNCDIVSNVGTHTSGDLFPVGETVVTYTATDVAGNIATCVFTVLVVDTEDPVISCPAPIVVDNDAGECSAIVEYEVTATDNCPMPGSALTPELIHGLSSGSAFPVGVTVVEYEVQDAAGNRSVCAFTVTVNDAEKPSLEPIDDMTFSLDNNCEFVIPDFSSMNAIQFSDNCDTDLKVSQEPAAGTVLAIHANDTLVSITVLDDAGNDSTRVFTLTVEDNEKPIVQLSGTTDVEVNSCEDLKTVYYTVQVDDNCEVVLSNIILTKDKVEDGTPFVMTGIPSNPFTFSLDLHPDDDGKLYAHYTDAGGNTGTSELQIDVDKNRGACEIIKEEIPVCAGITDENTSKEVRWLEENIAIKAFEDQEWRVMFSNGLYTDTKVADRLNGGGVTLNKEVSDDPADTANDIAVFKLPALYHISGEGYDIGLINKDGEMEFISGFGLYPTLEITQLEEGYCLGSTLETIVFEADEMGLFEIVDAGALNADIIATRQIDNTFEVDINPNELGITTGQVAKPYEIKVMFTGQHTVDINDMDLMNDDGQVNGDKRPGCPIMLTAPFEVREYKLTCNDDVTVKLDNSIDCAVNIIPDMLIENHCSNNDEIYQIRILDPEDKITKISGLNTDHVRLEGVTPGEYLFIIKVPTLRDSCWGFINIEDKDRPVCIADSLDLLPKTYSCTIDSEDFTFDELTEEDFADCTGIDEVHSILEKADLCPGDPLPPIEEVDYTPPTGWEVCGYMKKSWFADDLTGRTSDTCFQYVFIVRPESHLIKLQAEIQKECKDGLDPNEVKPYFEDLSIAEGGTGTTIYLEDGEHTCKYAATKVTGEKIPLCNTDGSKVYKQHSKWSVIDWCSGDKVYEDFDQLVEITDNEAPSLTAGEGWAHPGSFSCDATLTFTAASGTDCTEITGWHTVAQYFVTEGHNKGSFVREENDGNGITITQVPIGVVVEVTYTAWDICGNENKVTTMHHATDDAAPVCISNDELVVSLVPTDHDVNENGVIDADEHMIGARVFPEDLDDTSYDNCYPLIYEIRKAVKHGDEGENGPWGAFVEYAFDSADDLDDKCTIEKWVDLRITEDRNGNGLIDEEDRSTVCPSRLILREENAPSFTTELDCKWITCEDHDVEFDTPEYWGFCADLTYVDSDTTFHCPRFDIGCEGDFVTSQVGIIGNIGGVTGYKKRTWTLTKKTEHAQYSETIEQYIYIRDVIDESFAFPQDIKLECTTEGIPAPATLDEILTNKGCQEWVMDVKQDTFYGDADACFKIIRNYEFINWCRFDENLTDDNTQINKDCADLNGDGKLLAEDGEQVVISTNEIIAASNNQYVRNGRCIEGHSFGFEDLQLITSGYFNYTQVIKVVDNIDPSATIVPSVDCDENIEGCHQGIVEFVITPADSCSLATITDYEVVVTESEYDDIDTKFDINDNVVRGEGLPAATYTIKVRIDDACGNFVWATSSIKVEEFDCKKPTVIGVANFTALMENCTVDVWLNDILASASDNCDDSDYGDLEFGLSLANDGAPTKFSDAQSVTISAAGQNTVALWVRDASGKTQYALVPVVVIDNTGSCNRLDDKGVALVSGSITNESDEEIEDVMIIAKGNAMTDVASVFSGFYNFNLPLVSDVTISAEKDLNYQNGVSTADLVAIQRHILGVDEFTSPYTIIAGDVTGDEKINTRDLLDLVRLILGVTTDFDNVPSWRFVDKAYVFANPTQPWGFPEAIHFEALSADEQIDFMGIKMGDVTGNAKPTNLLGDDATAGSQSMMIVDALAEANQTVEIPFRAVDFNGLTGYQFTIQLASDVQLVDIVPGALPNLGEANFGKSHLSEGVLTTSWFNATAVDMKDDEVLFTLKVKAPRAAYLSELITMESSITNAEAYNDDLEALDLSLKFTQLESATTKLLQNTPNPFDAQTTIGFELPANNHVTFRIMNVAGQVVKQFEGDFAKGYNQVELDRDDLNASGVLYYEMSTSDITITKKMIILE